MWKTSLKTRLTIVTSLIISLGIAGLSPAIMRVVNAGVSVTVDKSTGQRCCCGTKEGKCCGMACCGVDTPKPKRTPAPQENRHDLGGSFWLICRIHTTLPKICNSECAAFRESSSIPAGCRLTTLRALQVLLQT
ncbi:MAG: hypothetical protein HUJ26_17955 [Planctomycetaceae bacterium]|nr:hypothetical protein [Planctomycetaceae bacterium]